MNTVVPERNIPSHQGPDAKTVIPDLDVVTIAVKASHNSSHLHTWWVELSRPRGDMWEVALWEDVLIVEGGQAYFTYQVFNQAIVVPETIDAIQALADVEPDASCSIAKTDAALGVTRDFLRAVASQFATARKEIEEKAAA